MNEVCLNSRRYAVVHHLEAPREDVILYIAFSNVHLLVQAISLTFQPSLLFPWLQALLLVHRTLLKVQFVDILYVMLELTVDDDVVHIGHCIHICRWLDAVRFPSILFGMYLVPCISQIEFF